ncbi:MAG: SGNH/GDSL hydrolase family protein [Actinobacteria bacterium]|nr:SGNH/GDSL hydrolase family protein [Actinomycetota bacterium]
MSDITTCTTWPQLWQPELAARPDTALLIVGNPGAQELLTPEGQWTRPCDSGYRDRYRSDLADGMAMLKGASGRVAVTTAGYWRPTPDRALPGVDYRAFDDQTDCLNELIRSVAADAGVPVLDMGAWICPSRDGCRLTDAGVTLRPDGIHYDGPGGPIAMRWLLSQLPD